MLLAFHWKANLPFSLKPNKYDFIIWFLLLIITRGKILKNILYEANELFKSFMFYIQFIVLHIFGLKKIEYECVNITTLQFNIMQWLAFGN